MGREPGASSHSRTRRLPAVSAALLALLLLLAALAHPTVPRAAASRAQPQLLEQAAQQPQHQLSVIVMKELGARGVEQQVAALGGTITRDLHIINAFAARVPGWAVSRLAGLPGVRVVAEDGRVLDTGKNTGGGGTTCSECINAANLKNTYNKTVRADQLWNVAPYLQGQGIGVAVVDSGVADPNLPSTLSDFSSGKRVVAQINTNSNTNNASDRYAHGTHVGGIIAGDGNGSSGKYIGIAPKANIISVKVSDDLGMAAESDVVAGLQWIYENKSKYNIRVVNLSLNVATNVSYHQSPLNAAVELLWFNGVVVVVSAGNWGKGALYPPANDPFVITVGAIDEKGTALLSDDNLASFSGYGTTIDGFAKPELAAPGVNLISVLAPGSVLAKSYPAHIVSGSKGQQDYFRMSGTSMAAPVVAGAVALLLQDEPTLTPDQVKHRLIATVYANGKNGSGAGTLDAYAAVHGTTTASANTGISPSQMISSGGSGWDSTSWNSVSWGSVSWGSVSWGSVSWGSVSWGSTDWSQ